MKLPCIFIFLLLSIIFLGSGNNCSKEFHSSGLSRGVSGKKKALIISISEYQDKGFKKLDGPPNDLILLNDALHYQGFEESDIIVLKENQATRTAILKGLEQLKENTSKGDIIFIHYSGHGQQIVDFHNDEDDGLDECLVPYDAIAKYDNTYKGEKHIIDDDFGVIINEIRTKAGKNGNVVVSVDACYSGTITRGNFETAVRSGPKNNLNLKNVNVIKATGIYEGSLKSRGDDNDMANYVVFSACNANEEDHETYVGNTIYGPLSYAMHKAMKNSKPGMTYRLFFDIIKKEICNLCKQTPQLEGDADVSLFSGNVVEQKPFYEVTAEGNYVSINAGTIMGIFAETEVTFYPKGTTDPRTSIPVATGIVIQSGELVSQIKLNSDVKPSIINDTWAFITKRSFGDLRINVLIDNLGNPSLENNIKSELQKYKIINIVSDNPDLLICNNAGKDTIYIKIASENHILRKVSLNENDLSTKITDSVRNFSAAKYINSMNLNCPEIQFTAEIIPIVPILAYENPCKISFKVDKTENKFTNGNNIVFDSGGYFNFKITNTGKAAFYFNILNITSSGKIEQKIPRPRNKKQITDDCRKISPGNFTEITIRCGPPYGRDIWKIIASAVPLNFEEILATRGTETKRTKDPLELLFADIISSRGPEGPVSSETVTTYELVCYVQPKK
jgi:hypothetical protein